MTKTSHIMIQASLLTMTMICEVAIADITVITPLSFGRVAMSGSSSGQEIIVSAAGDVRYNGGIYPIERASRGAFQLSNFPAHQVLMISLQIIPASSGSPFTLTNINTSSYITADANGEAVLYIGGTLALTGNSTVSANNIATYQSHYQISINY